MNQKEFFKLVETEVEAFVKAGGKLRSGSLIREDGSRCAMGCLAREDEITMQLADRLEVQAQYAYHIEYGFDAGFTDAPVSQALGNSKAYQFGYRLGVKYRPPVLIRVAIP